MDPDATLQAIIDAATDYDLFAADEYYYDYLDWCAQGGFPGTEELRTKARRVYNTVSACVHLSHTPDAYNVPQSWLTSEDYQR